MIRRDCANYITDGIFIGDKNDAVNLTFLKKNNIKAILNTAFDIPKWEEDKLKKHNIAYLKLPMSDSPTEDIKKYYLRAYQFISENTLPFRDSNVLVHCAVGMSRSVTMVFAYLLLEGYTFEESWKLVKKRKIAQPNTGFMEQLRYLANTLKKPRAPGGKGKFVDLQPIEIRRKSIKGAKPFQSMFF
jgi:protein-tyrosine phosphatase